MKVLFFAALREQLQCDALELQATTVAALRQQLRQRWPQHADLLSAEQALVAINQVLNHDEQQSLNDADEVAFFPPMTGG
ncbi:molybdopterin synthase sulfur carrier subunit [Bacterioplanes sanyensis]|uniref:molybdopterin converting factor subunit 1 n=1 Tax=Bacterioplanes sanyensis TaxID=1249553 RepID=UPI00167775D0|nr:molybdopterin converting factor subunit 1 [Bacterioplanes sanyensis]GGY53270.1 molybdopterin synthase sulfur carrier subunit [Bacterioplanes sanyensis]